MAKFINADGAVEFDDHPLISRIESGLPPHGFDLFIGGADAARNIALLREHNIAIVINCAVNLDINYVIDPKAPAEGESCAYGAGPIRAFKLGLVDGPGNSADMMLAGFFLMDGAIHQVIPDKASYPHRAQGNVLVHCRGGRSRSPALVALFLHLHLPHKFPTLDAALSLVREKRRLHPEEWDTAPKPMLIEAARRAAAIVNRIRQANPAET